MSVPRSLLYVPAARRDFLEKATRAKADLILVDLEDGVAPEAKALARENLRNAVSAGTLSPAAPWMLRVNAGPAGPPADDLVLVGFARPSWVVLPKAEDPAAVRALAARFAEQGARTALTLETARGIAAARELASCHPGIGMLILGSADLRVSLGASPDPERRWERHAMDELLLAARCTGAAAIDAVWFRPKDAPGLRKHAAIARTLGYDGKSCIHPSQVPVVHRVFAPTRAERLWARKVLASWSAESGASKGVIVVDGEMIEALHVALAEKILARD